MAQGHAMPVANADGATRLAFIRKVYIYFSLTLLTCIGAVAVVVNTPSLLDLALRVRLGFILVGLLGSFAVYLVRKIPVVNTIALLVLGGCIGMLTAPLVAYVSIKDPKIVTSAFIMTCTVFGSLTAWVFISRKDYSWMGGMLFVGFIVLVVASLVFWFIAPSSGIYYAYLIGGTLIMAGYVLYDTSLIIHHLNEDEHITGAMSLFFDFVNLFIFILQLLNSRE